MDIKNLGGFLYNRAGAAYGKTVTANGKTAGKTDTAKAMGLDYYEPSGNIIKDEELSASSGNDTLGILRGEKENSFVIRFTNSAMVSRAVKRGYITVNGVDITLSEDIKQKLKTTDMKAEAKRQSAFNEYILQHDLAVAEQQAEALSSQGKNESELLKIALKIMTGGKVSKAEEQKLMQGNPQLYAMAKMSATLAGKKTQRVKDQPEQTQDAGHTQNITDAANGGVSWQQFEWKGYETQMTVTMGTPPAIDSVNVGEVSLNG